MQAFIDPRFEVNGEPQTDWIEGSQTVSLVNPKGDLRTNVTVFSADDDKGMDGFFAVAMHPQDTVRTSQFKSGYLTAVGKYVIDLGDHHTAFVSEQQFEALYQSMTKVRDDRLTYRR